MIDSAILEVIVGLIFIFSLLSILVTQINSIVVNLLNYRARHLKQGVEILISDPVVRAKVLAHPLIQLVPQKVMPEAQMSAQSAEQVTASEATKVAWIDAPIFANVLVNVLTAGFEAQRYAPLYAVIKARLNGADETRMRELVRRLQSSVVTFDEVRAAVNALPIAADREPILDALQQVEISHLQAHAADGSVIPLLESLHNVGDPAFQRALETVLSTARSLDDGIKKLETWFDTTMERLTDSYKTQMQLLSLLIGLALAVILNVDSLYVARTLWEDSTVRNALAQAAQASLESGAIAGQVSEASANLEGALEATPEPGSGQTDTAQRDVEASIQQASGTIDQLLSLRLPIGWEVTTLPPDADALALAGLRNNMRNAANFLPSSNPNWFGFLLYKLVGWALTTLAIAQGAPFWFDLLNRIARGGR